jgi:nucleotide-binding universal stress UspA family protein
MSRITVGVDGSAEARAALLFALEEARLRGAELEVILAYSPLPYLADDVVLRHQESSEAEAEELLRKEVEPAAAGFPEVTVTTRAILGTAARTLIEMSEGSDLLVVGSRGRGGFSGLLLGSVSQQCVHHAPCPVVVVPRTA